MLQLHTRKDSEGVREGLRRLIAGDGRARGQINGDTFRLRPRSRRKSVSVTLYGRITPDRDGTLVSAWPFPHWAIILWFPVWALFCFAFVHAPIWFVVLGFIGGIFSFVIETRKAYDLLRENVA
jgi:hypothetical protein